MHNVTIAPLSGHVPDGFKPPVCQTTDCTLTATWLARGKTSLVACDQHLTPTITVLSEAS